VTRHVFLKCIFSGTWIPARIWFDYDLVWI